MSLRFFYGRAATGKSTFCYQDIKRHFEKYTDKNFILIVPEQFSLESEKNLIKALGKNGIINAEVLSFKRLAFRIFDQEGGKAGTRLNKHNKLIILSRIIKENEDKLPFYSKALNKNGFINNISDLITEFKSYSIGIENINQIINENIRENTKIKINEFKIIYEEYEEYISERFIDPDDDLTILAKRIPSAKFIVNSYFWIDEFSGFTPSEYKVIESLLLAAKSVNISISTDILFDENKNDIEDVFRTNKITINKIKEIAKNNNVNISEPIKFDSKSSKNNELQHIEKQYFSYPNTYFKGSIERIKIGRMSNMFEEISYVAEEIEKLVKSLDYKYSNINIICRNPDNYFESIKGIFDFYNIPLFLDKKKDINGYPLIIFIKSLLQIFIEKYNYKSVFGYLKTGLSGICENDIDDLENHVLEYGIRGDFWNNNKRWEFKDLEKNQHLIEIRDNFLSSISKIKDDLHGKNTVSYISKQLYEFLIEFKIKDRLEELYEDSSENLKDENIKTWNLFIDILDSLVNTIGTEEATLSEYLNYLEISLSESKLGVLPENADTVFVGSIDRSINHSIKVLFILGVNDGVFPSIPKESGILNDIDRLCLKDNGLEIALDTKERVYEEEFLIYKALTTPSDRLYLTYLTADSDGKSMRPSNIISRMKKLFPSLVENKYKNESSSHWNSFLNHLRNSSYIEKSINEPNIRDILDILMKVDTEKLNNSDLLYGETLNTTVSKLESYAKCPFKYFIEYGLGAKDRKVLSLRLPDIGTILHDSIEKLSKELWIENLGWDSIDNEELNKRIEKIYIDVSNEKIGWILENVYSYKEISNRILKLIKKSIFYIAKQINKSSFRPLLYEISFGDSLKIPPLKIHLKNNQEINIHGRIDRVDKFTKDMEEYIRIIDYKSGKKTFELSDVYNGIELQLVTYLEVIEGEKSVPGGIFYFNLDDPRIKFNEDMDTEKLQSEMEKKFKLSGLVLNDKEIIKAMDNDFQGDSKIIPVKEKKDGTMGKNSKIASREEFEYLKEHVNKKLVEYGESILSGEINIKPIKKKDKSTCTYCDYKFICKFDKKDSKYKNIVDYSDEYVLEKLKEKYNKEVENV